MKIAINLPAELKTMTAKTFIKRYGVCVEAEKWMRKIGLNHTMEFFWNRCARRGWLQYILCRNYNDEWRKIEGLLNGKQDAYGWTVDHHEAQRFRDAIEINWV